MSSECGSDASGPGDERAAGDSERVAAGGCASGIVETNEGNVIRILSPGDFWSFLQRLSCYYNYICTQTPPILYPKADTYCQLFVYIG